MGMGHTWDRESREFKIILEIFEERFPKDFIRDWHHQWPWDDQYDVEETFFQGFLAAWEFLRKITESNDKLLEEVSKLTPPKWESWD